MLTDYTTYASIRATLGVSTDDLTDETLGLDLYDDYLTQDLEDIAVTLPDTYATTKAVSVPTALEIRFLKACSIFATLAVALRLTPSLPMFAAKLVTDGKSQGQRFDTGYKETVAAITPQFDQAKARLAALLLAMGTATTAPTPRVLFGIISPSSDPVTGTGT